jgi:hypothetical protein
LESPPETILEILEFFCTILEDLRDNSVKSMNHKYKISILFIPPQIPAESGGIQEFRRNPQELTGIPEFRQIPPESTGMGRNRQKWT